MKRVLPYVMALFYVGAGATIALLIAVYPANIHVAWNSVPMADRSDGLGIWNWVRLPVRADRLGPVVYAGVVAEPRRREPRLRRRA